MLTLMTVFYGDSSLYKLELFGSILSAFSMAAENEIEIVIYTDSDLSDFPFPVTTYSIEKAQKASMQDGQIDTHLVKTCCLVEALDKLARPFIYFDTDIFFNVSPAQLFAKISDTDVLMHATEMLISELPSWDKLRDHIENQLEPNDFGLNSQSMMHNSGIIGLTPTHKSAIDRSVELAKNLYKVVPMFTIEQFSTGVMLSASSKMHTCEEEVFHYWGWQREFIHIELQRFRDKHRHSSSKEIIQAYRDHPIKRDPINIIDRLATTIKSRFNGWVGNYRWAYLLYLSALRRGINDREMANALYQRCIAALLQSKLDNEGFVGQSGFKKDFKRLFESQGSVSKWIDGNLNDEMNKLASQ
ncbi:MAG: hypothetical protein ACJA2E_001512 [Arenicella sp.]|jgi:hypothetical protein